MINKNLRIVFMGTPEFAVESLNALVKAGYNIVGVITATDKPAGRGQQVQYSDVKKYALEKGLNILQPEKLKNEDFLQQLRSLNADLQIVVAFRMLPELVWNMPRLGTFNLHGSLLPQYRGAAPINWAVMNGEKETGVTTFFLQQEIDTGPVIFQERIPIGPNETAGELHDKMKLIGAQLVVKTVQAIENGNYPQIPQASIPSDELKAAPKLFKEHMRIDWNQSVEKIHHHILGLSPYPTAFTDFTNSRNETVQAKIFRANAEHTAATQPPGTVISDGKKSLKIAATDGFIHIQELQQAGKKRMTTEEFLRGFSFNVST